MVRGFRLVNEKGQEYSLMDIYNYCLLTEPEGLGYSYDSEYEQLGNTFITNLRKMGQGQISGQLNFKNYDNYRNLIDFIESSESLRIAYKVPYSDGAREYFKDVEIQEITKTEKQTNGIISETINFDCLSLWYEENTVIYSVEPASNEMRWDFRWDSRFSDYTSRGMSYVNNGHIEAPIHAKIKGPLVNPKIELYIDNQIFQTVEINTTLSEYESLIYDSRENQFEISKINSDGTKTSLFSLDYIDFSNDNVIRIPKNKSCTINLAADNEVLDAQLTIYPRYKSV